MAPHSLIVFKKDWADEFDCQSFRIYEGTPQQAIDSVNNRLKQCEGSFYFGTNEGWEDGEVTLDDFKITELTAEEAAVMLKLFPSKRFGTGF